MANLPVRKVELEAPSLERLADAIRDGIKADFATTSVHIATPPDLRNSPFHLAGPGLSGNVRIADVGGQSNLAPSPNFDARYDLLTVSQLMEMSPDGGVLIGASAGPFHVLGRNTELMPNVAYGPGTRVLESGTRYAKVTEAGGVLCERIGASTAFGLMGNLLGCDGLAGPALHITAKGRTGSANFTDSIRSALSAVFGDRLVSLGGVFVVQAGTVKLHVMPDFAKEPLSRPEGVERWLRFFDTGAPLVCLSVLHSGDDMGLGLRMEHTHCFAGEGPDASARGGHYHFDLDDTRDDVEYEGWFNVAEVLYRIDQPGAH
ncbi:hypothetical protein BX600DRAFT_513686 [Xylariales sp. PMI_506]|nr:hypothetical protein BX600DRAFT_513686 [Xylariales sp. PMI_506]